MHSRLNISWYTGYFFSRALNNTLKTRIINSTVNVRTTLKSIIDSFTGNHCPRAVCIEADDEERKKEATKNNAELDY